MKQNRIEIRASLNERKQFEQAANLCGMNLSEFLRRTALDKSFEVIRKNDSIILSNIDKETFLNALENPPEPNKNLKQALKHYNRLTKKG